MSNRPNPTQPMIRKNPIKPNPTPSNRGQIQLCQTMWTVSCLLYTYRHVHWCCGCNAWEMTIFSMSNWIHSVWRCRLTQRWHADMITGCRRSHRGLVLCRLLLSTMTERWCRGRWPYRPIASNQVRWLMSWQGWGAGNEHLTISRHQQRTESVEQLPSGRRRPERWGTAGSHQRTGAVRDHETQRRCSG